jgi:hypothetical protein
MARKHQIDPEFSWRSMATGKVKTIYTEDNGNIEIYLGDCLENTLTSKGG